MYLVKFQMQVNGCIMWHNLCRLDNGQNRSLLSSLTSYFPNIIERINGPRGSSTPRLELVLEFYIFLQ